MAIDWKKEFTTARDKRKALYDQRTKTLPAKYNTVAVGEERDAILQQQIALLDEEISLKEQEVFAKQMLYIELLDTEPEPEEAQAAEDAWQLEVTILANLKVARDTAMQKYNQLRLQNSGQKADLNNQAALKAAAAASTVTNTPIRTSAAGAGGSSSLKYNASSVKEAYFSNKTSFSSRVMQSINSPSTVGRASELWTTALGSKGMIITSEQVLQNWQSGPQNGNSYADQNNWGFQFQYNPGTVDMTYYTSPNVDVTMVTSGTEMFNLAGVSGSQGSINFQLIINRIFDMQYYNRDGLLVAGGNTVYPRPPVGDAEQKMLYNKGTMYDIEYLLRTLMGTTMSSYLRGENTADMGWLPAIPVELHLGKSLRYLGTVNNINLNHLIFDERMVPLFTTVDIGFARLPDYPPAGNPGRAGQ
jgi:hypothetical protein